jgi:hypothetical protein
MCRNSEGVEASLATGLSIALGFHPRLFTSNYFVVFCCEFYDKRENRYFTVTKSW